MTRNENRLQKIIYIVLIILLIIPLYLIGYPSSKTGKVYLKSDAVSSNDSEKNGTADKKPFLGNFAYTLAVPLGQNLSESRNGLGFSEANLGEIDPASSTMKLATFGMRGVAIALLWNRALENEKRTDWNGVLTTGRQITMLEPHFITVWDFVGWKLAYNASAQFDDYRGRYRWVIKGFKFIDEGTKYNQTAPRLFQKAGWTISQKIGIADEKMQYRRLFRSGDGFEEENSQLSIKYDPNERDNWLFGRKYYQVAEKLYENGGDIGKETRSLFYSYAPMNLIHYATWLTKDGCGLTQDNTPIFDERVRESWKNAQESWKTYGEKVVTTTIAEENNPDKYRQTSMVKYEESIAEIKKKRQQIIALFPEGKTEESICWDRWCNLLTDQERAGVLNYLKNPAPEYDVANGENHRSIRIVRSYLDGEHGEQPEWADWQAKLQKIYDDIYTVDEEIQTALSIPSVLRETGEEDILKPGDRLASEFRNQALQKLNLTPEVLAENVEDVGNNRSVALDICSELKLLAEEARFSNLFRTIMNYDFREYEVRIEQEPNATLAREERYKATVARNAGQFEAAKQHYLTSIGLWEELSKKNDYIVMTRDARYITDFVNDFNYFAENILDKLEEFFPETFPLQGLIRSRIQTDTDYFNICKAQDYISNLYQEKKYDEVITLCDKIIPMWMNLIYSYEFMQLSPLPEVRDEIIEIVQIYADSWIKIGGTALENAQATGKIETYPLKSHLELLIGRVEPAYEKALQAESAAFTEPDKALEHLAEAVEQWDQIIKKYPILYIDNSSIYRNYISRVADAYVNELRKKEQSVPEDFKLKEFLSR